MQGKTHVVTMWRRYVYAKIGNVIEGVNLEAEPECGDQGLEYVQYSRFV